MRSTIAPAFLTGALLALAACSTPVPVAAAAPASAAVAAAAPASSCPTKTQTLYQAPLPTPGFVPAPPRGAAVVQPKRLLGVAPAYPSASFRCRERGKVVITYCVSPEGKVENVLVISSSGFARLDNAVLAWADRDRHTPGTVNGKPSLFCGLHAEHEFTIDRETDGGPAR